MWCAKLHRRRVLAVERGRKVREREREREPIGANTNAALRRSDPVLTAQLRHPLGAFIAVNLRLR